MTAMTFKQIKFHCYNTSRLAFGRPALSYARWLVAIHFRTN